MRGRQVVAPAAAELEELGAHPHAYRVDADVVAAGIAAAGAVEAGHRIEAAHLQLPAEHVARHPHRQPHIPRRPGARPAPDSAGPALSDTRHARSDPCAASRGETTLRRSAVAPPGCGCRLDRSRATSSANPASHAQVSSRRSAGSPRSAAGGSASISQRPTTGRGDPRGPGLPGRRRTAGRPARRWTHRPPPLPALRRRRTPATGSAFKYG